MLHLPEKTRFRGFFRWSQKPGQAGLQTVDKALSTVFRFSALQRREHHVPVRKAHGRNMIAEAACSRSSRRTRRRCGLYLEGCGPPSLPKGFSAEAACCRSRRAEAGIGKGEKPAAPPGERGKPGRPNRPKAGHLRRTRHPPEGGAHASARKITKRCLPQENRGAVSAYRFRVRRLATSHVAAMPATETSSPAPASATGLSTPVAGRVSALSTVFVTVSGYEISFSE